MRNISSFSAGGLAAVFLLTLGCSTSHVLVEQGAPGGSGDEPKADDPVTPSQPEQPRCEKTASTETSCSDGVDQDCDGYVDCRDSECEGLSCGTGAGLSCTLGACLAEAPELPELPPVQNVRVTMNGDTALVEFEPVAGARDYRIYPLPKDEDILAGEDGELVVRDAIYRCAGDRPFTKRADDPAGFFDASLTANVRDYQRTEEEAVLGYAFNTPGPGREAVYRLANPNGAGGYAWDYVNPPGIEYNSSDYVVGEAARDALLAKGFRDDGVAFYVTSQGTRPVYRREYPPDHLGPNSVLYYSEGPEFDFHQSREEDVVSMEERFRLLEAPEADAVPVYRVFYLATNAFDVLAAGESRYERTLHQGNLPVWSLTWPGLEGPTTLVVEALDEGCPFPNGYIAASAAPGDPATDGHYPSLTVEDARLETGEVFINGQHAPESRPRPIARAFVDVAPVEEPSMDWYEDFGKDAVWPEFQIDKFNNGIDLRRNDDWLVEFSGCSAGNTVGPVLGQLVFGGGDFGSSCNMSIIPRKPKPELKRDSYLHVRMTVEVPSTHRRYPQLLLTTTKTAEVGELNENDLPVRHRLGPMPFAEDYVKHSGTEHTLIVQPFGSTHELQIQYCNRRGWGVSAQCPRANLYGYHVGSWEDEWEEPWYPVPVLGEMAGHDRPVRFDVYASTERVYVLLDGKPAGCAILPEGQMPEGPITPVFGSVIYHGGIDEAVTPETSPHQYLRSYSLMHYDRKLDELGLDGDVPPPAWDESVLPCGARWYGAEE